jgi:hypothetical protein
VKRAALLTLAATACAGVVALVAGPASGVSSTTSTTPTSTTPITLPTPTVPPVGATVTFTSPVRDGEYLSQSPILLSGTADRTAGTITQIVITVTWSDTAHRVPGSHPASSTTFTPDIDEASAPWSFGPRVPFNGQYTAEVTATSYAGPAGAEVQTSEQVTGTRTFVVDLPPAAPTGLTVTVNQSNRTTELTWNPNPEPDLFGYEVLRSGPGSVPATVIAYLSPSAQPSYADDQVATQPPGAYIYRIVAVREDGAGNGADLSGPSAAADASFATPAAATAPGSATTHPTTPAAGPTATTGKAAPTATTPVLAPAPQSVPSYLALLQQAQQTTVTTAAPDPGYGQKLPYRTQVSRTPILLPALDPTGTLGASDGDGGRKTVELIAAALILAVLALFGLLLRKSADQADLLDALVPAGEGGALALAAQDGSALGEPEPAVDEPEPVPVAVDKPVPVAVDEPEPESAPMAVEQLEAVVAADEPDLEPVAADEPDIEPVGLGANLERRLALADAGPEAEPELLALDPDPITADSAPDPAPDPAADPGPDPAADSAPDPAADSAPDPTPDAFPESAPFLVLAPTATAEPVATALPATEPAPAPPAHTDRWGEDVDPWVPLVSPLMLSLTPTTGGRLFLSEQAPLVGAVASPGPELSAAG